MEILIVKDERLHFNVVLLLPVDTALSQNLQIEVVLSSVSSQNYVA